MEGLVVGGEDDVVVWGVWEGGGGGEVQEGVKREVQEGVKRLGGQEVVGYGVKRLGGGVKREVVVWGEWEDEGDVTHIWGGQDVVWGEWGGEDDVLGGIHIWGGQDLGGGVKRVHFGGQEFGGQEEVVEGGWRGIRVVGGGGEGEVGYLFGGFGGVVGGIQEVEDEGEGVVKLWVFLRAMVGIKWKPETR